MRTDVELESWKQNLKDILLGCTCWSSKLTFDWRFAFWLRKSPPHWGSRWLEDYEKCDIDVHCFQGWKEGGPKSTSWWYPFCENCMWVKCARTWQELDTCNYSPSLRWTTSSCPKSTHRPCYSQVVGSVPYLLAMSKEFCATCRH